MLLAKKHRVQVRIALAHFFEAEVLLCEATGILPEPLAQRSIQEKFFDGVRETGFVAGGDQRSALIVDQFRIASYVVGDNRKRRGHRFEDDV